MKRLLVLATLTVVSTFGCAPGAYLESSIVDQGKTIDGTFSVILYGGNYLNDLETFALLDPEGDAYEIVPFAPAFNYRVVKGLTASQALGRAEALLKSHSAYNGFVLREIRLGDGAVVGYEVRPRYMPVVYGNADVLRSRYRLEDGGRVIADISVDPWAQNGLFYGGDGTVREGR